MTLHEYAALEEAEGDQFGFSGLLVPRLSDDAPIELRRNLSTDELREIARAHPVDELRMMARARLAERLAVP